MPDMEKVKKGVWQCWLPSTEEEYETQCHDCPYYEPGITLEECMTALRTDILAMLKEQEAQKQSILKNIADTQLANSPDEWQSPEQRMYSKGVFDGLQMAYEMLAYGVVKKDA